MPVPGPSGILFSNPIVQPLSSNGQLMAGCIATFYFSDSTTLAPIYGDGGLTMPTANPLTATASGSFNPVWLDPDIVYRIVITTSTGVLVADVDPVIPSAIAGLTSDVVGKILYPLTAAEITLSVTPTNFGYPADPYVDPRRYGADQFGSGDSTAAVQTAINVAYQAKGLVWIGNNCNYSCGALSLTMTGNHTNDGFRMMGSMVNGSRITQRGTPSAMLTITGQTPTGNPQESPLILENFTIACTGKTCDGIVITGLGEFELRKVYVGFANRALFLNSALIGTVEFCELYGSNYGAFIRQDGTGSQPNLIELRRNRIFGNSVFGVDFNDGDELTLNGNDLEANGTSGNTATGAVHLGNNLQSANGFAHNYLTENHIENNFGWSVLVDAQTGGSLVDLQIEGGKIISAQSGQAIKILGGQMTRIANVKSPSPGDTWNITSALAVLEDVTVSVLTDTGITYPTYTNVATSGGVQVKGRRDNFTGTGTGFSGTAPSANVAVYQQGDEITLVFSGAITGTSNSTACTITGLPAKYWPASDSFGVMTVQDNGANSAMSCQVAAATGVITVGFGHTFTGSGGKGVVGGSLTYRRP